MAFKLLSPMATNSKTKKGASLPYHGAILHLAPYNLSGVNVCPKASKGCAAACLNTAGRGKFSNVQAARLRKTRLFIESRDEFLGLLDKDLEKLAMQAKKKGLQAVCRLNGTSDLTWFAMVQRHPYIQFYDYTKRLDLVKKLRQKQRAGLCLNYYLTFSLSESNLDDALQAQLLNVNVAAVFENREAIPDYFLNAETYDGESHDFRFLDPCGDGVGLICALTAKGDAKKDSSGFVQNAETFAGRLSQSLVNPYTAPIFI